MLSLTAALACPSSVSTSLCCFCRRGRPGFLGKSGEVPKTARVWDCCREFWDSNFQYDTDGEKRRARRQVDRGEGDGEPLHTALHNGLANNTRTRLESSLEFRGGRTGRTKFLKGTGQGRRTHLDHKSAIRKSHFPRLGPTHTYLVSSRSELRPLVSESEAGF